MKTMRVAMTILGCLLCSLATGQYDDAMRFLREADAVIIDKGIDELRVELTGRAMELLRAGDAAPRVFPRH